MIDEGKLIEDILKHSNNITSEWETAGILNLINQQQKVNKWIPCSERLPEINGQYLCQIKGSLKNAYFDVFCFSDDLYSVDEYDFHKYRGKKKKSGFYDYDSEWGYFEVRGVVAWMPLPESHKGE